jgi:hypothetical protein
MKFHNPIAQAWFCETAKKKKPNKKFPKKNVFKKYNEGKMKNDKTTSKKK